MPTVSRRLTISIRDHGFPPSRLLSPRIRAWDLAEVEAWIDRRPVGKVEGHEYGVIKQQRAGEGGDEMRRPATDGRPLTKISKVRLPARLHDADHEPPRQGTRSLDSISEFPR